MNIIAPLIDLNLPQKLKNKAYRLRFFWAESSAHIAGQLIALRKRRGLSQKQVADLAGTKQPAISRAEQADYQNWNLGTIRSIANVLDARVRVIIEPSEDVLWEYEADRSDKGRTLTAEQKDVDSGPMKPTAAGDAVQHERNPIVWKGVQVTSEGEIFERGSEASVTIRSSKTAYAQPEIPIPPATTSVSVTLLV